MNAIDPSVYYIIGMSPGNSYFKDDEIKYLLQTTLGRYGRVAIMIADVPAISTYIALGYDENRARRDKAIPQGNLLKNRTKRIIEKLGYRHEQVQIIDWQEEVESNSEYQVSYKKVVNLYKESEIFKKSANETTRAVLEGSKKEIADMDRATEIAVHYLLSEFAFMDWVPTFLGVEKAVYIYHKNWPVYEEYIAGKYDGVPKIHQDFLLMENPYETFNPIWGLEEEGEQEFENTLERVEKTKILRVAVTNYPPALIYNRESNTFSGIFYEIVNKIAEKYGWKIIWTEETGYGVILDGLEEKRFDIFASTVWPTPERMEKAEFSTSLYESEVFVWVREDFDKTVEEIKKDQNIRVVIKENDISHSIAKADFSNNRAAYVPQLAEPIDLLKFVAEGKGDFTFVEPYLANVFNQTSSVKLKKASSNPIRIYENTFMFEKGDVSLKDLFDKELEEMKQSGFIKELVEKYIGDRE